MIILNQEMSKTKYTVLVFFLLISCFCNSQEKSLSKIHIIKKTIDTLIKLEKVNRDSTLVLGLLDIKAEKLSYVNGPSGTFLNNTEAYQDTMTLNELKKWTDPTKDSNFLIFSMNEMKYYHRASLIYSFTFPAENESIVARGKSRLYFEIMEPIEKWSIIDLYLNKSISGDFKVFNRPELNLPIYLFYSSGKNQIQKNLLIKYSFTRTQGQWEFQINNISEF
jgi:hypothetical protein